MSRRRSIFDYLEDLEGEEVEMADFPLNEGEGNPRCSTCGEKNQEYHVATLFKVKSRSQRFRRMIRLHDRATTLKNTKIYVSLKDSSENEVLYKVIGALSMGVGMKMGILLRPTRARRIQD